MAQPGLPPVPGAPGIPPGIWLAVKDRNNEIIVLRIMGNQYSGILFTSTMLYCVTLLHVNKLHITYSNSSRVFEACEIIEEWFLLMPPPNKPQSQFS